MPTRPIPADNARGYTRINVRATTEEKNQIRAAAGRAGMPAAGWIRERLLDAAGYADTERRPARMRGGRRTRPDLTEGNAPVGVSVSPTEKAAIGKAAVQAGKSTSEWIRDVIADALAQDGGQQR